MSDFICPMCGSPNDENADLCEVCKVDFTRLPNDLKPQKLQNRESSEKTSLRSELTQDSNLTETPDWLRKRIQTKENPQNQASSSIDNYLNMIFGRTNESAEANEDAAEPDHQNVPFSREDLEALDLSENSESPNTDVSPEELETYSDFETIRPERKWDSDNESEQNSASEVQESFNDLPDAGTASKQADPEKVQSKKAAAIDPGLLPEEVFNDFSIIRPQSKWDGEESDSQNLEIDQSDANPLRDAQLALFNESDIDSDSKGADLTEEESQFFDFTVNRPQRKWDASDQSDSAAEDSVSSSQFAFESLDEILSDPRLLDDENGAMDEESVSKQVPEQEPSLVDSLLTQILSNEPTDPGELPLISASENNPSSYYETNKPSSQIEIDPELEFLIDDQDTAQRPTESEPNHQQDQPDELTAFVQTEDTFPENLLTDDIVPDSYDLEADDLDEVPWDLFETGDMTLPGTNYVETSSYKSFSKSGIPEEKKNQDYQQRMISTILERVFQTEGLNRPLTKTRSRGSKKTSQLMIAITVLIGILFLLFSGIFDFIPLNPPSMESFPDLVSFNQSFEEIDSESDILVVIDYTPGFSNELGSSASALLQKLNDRQAKVQIITTNPSAAILTSQLQSTIASPEILSSGYLPGGVLAIQNLLAGNPDSFDALYLVSANFDSARAWLEQISTLPTSIPVHIIGSAQIQSLIEPYRRTSLIHSSISSPLEKDLFAGKSISSPQEKRKTLSLWALVLFAVLAFLAGSMQRSPYQSILSDEKSRSNKGDIQPDHEKLKSSEKGATDHDVID